MKLLPLALLTPMITFATDFPAPLSLPVVPTLPDPLVACDGTVIKTRKQWEPCVASSYAGCFSTKPLEQEFTSTRHTQRSMERGRLVGDRNFAMGHFRSRAGQLQIKIAGQALVGHKP
jgi:hypothetical protein